MSERPSANPGDAAAPAGSLDPQGSPEDHQLALRVTPMPADVNANGDIFGGWVMAQVDVAGGVSAARRARGRVVTVAVNSFQFKQPVSVGDLVSFYTRVVATGRTSITVHVEVLAERDPAAPVTVKVTEATLTYVAIDAQGRKREVPAAR
jgi:acyl-CoA thioesterase YciA